MGQEPIPNRIRPLRVACTAIALCVWLVSPAAAQRVQSGVSTGAVDIPQTNLVPITPPATGFGTPSSGLNPFDPYASATSAAPLPSAPPAVIPPPTVGGNQPGAPIGTGAVIGPPSPVLPGGTGRPNVGLPNSAAAPIIGVPPTIQPSPPGSSLFSRIFARPTATPATPGFSTTIESPTLGSQPMYGAPPVPTTSGVFDAPSIYAPAPQPGYSPPIGYGPPTGYAPPSYPSTIYPSSTPNSLFPEGLFNTGPFSPGFNIREYPAFRFFQGPRLRHGYVSRGSKPAHLGMNDTDTSLVFAFPNFLYTAQPIFIAPSFSLHLWDGPNGIIGADLPSKAYSAFLDVGWESNPNAMFGTELGVRLGAFTDFDTWNSKSFRVRGKGLFSFRLTPTSTFKAGVYYVDRNRVKLLPAGGFLCRPNPFTKIDLFFPKPQFARYCRTVGVYDVWWYLTGDFGGGNWTLRRTDLTEDRVDINDLRAVVGIEWGVPERIRLNRRAGFFEVGYVFSREVRYKFNPLDDFEPENGIMFRAGIGY